MCAWEAGGASRADSSSPGMPRRGGFSLIELIVAMLVLAVLVSIMLPALHRTMRYSAPLVRCSANIRQLHQALVLYLSASNDAMPLAGYDCLRDANTPPLNKTLAEYGVGDIAFWTCPADPRPRVVIDRWGSRVYPAGRYMQVARRRIRVDELGPEYPLLADRGPFHLTLQESEQSLGPAESTPDPSTSPNTSGFYEGHNSVWVSGRITSHAREKSETRK